jgi:predicted nucleic acid-binding Zn finger protein
MKILSKLIHNQFVVQGTSRKYTVSLEPGNVFCSCDFFVFNKKKNSYLECSHIKEVKNQTLYTTQNN